MDACSRAHPTTTQLTKEREEDARTFADQECDEEHRECWLNDDIVNEKDCKNNTRNGNRTTTSTTNFLCTVYFQLREVPVSICIRTTPPLASSLAVFAIVNCVSHIYGAVINMVSMCIQPPPEVQFIDFLPIFRSFVPFSPIYTMRCLTAVAPCVHQPCTLYLGNTDVHIQNPRPNQRSYRGREESFVCILITSTFDLPSFGHSII